LEEDGHNVQGIPGTKAQSFPKPVKNSLTLYYFYFPMPNIIRAQLKATVIS
jgi:hypothetical protein